MLTRLRVHFRSSPYQPSINHPGGLRDHRSRSLTIIHPNRARPALTGLGQGLKRVRGPVIRVRMAHEDPRNLERELEDGIRPWTGPSVFITSLPAPKSIKSARTKSGTGDGIGSGNGNGNGKGKSTPSRIGRGDGASIKSPICVSSAESTPVPTSRVRGVIRYESPIPRTAYTPPRPPRSTSTNTADPNTLTSPNPVSGTLGGASAGAIRVNRGTNVHPFFMNGQTSVVRQGNPDPTFSTVPSSQRPRYVAHYSSTDTSTSPSVSGSQSTHSQSTQSTFDSQPTSTVRDRHRVRGKGKGKVDDVRRARTGTRAGGPPEGWTDDAIDQLVDDFATTRIGTSGIPKVLVGGTARSSAPPLRTSSHNTSTDGTSSGSGATKYPSHQPPRTNIASNPSNHPKPQPKPKSKSKVRPPAEEPDPNITYFQYTSLPAPLTTPKLAYTTDPIEADLLISCLKGPILGFDLEWPPAGLQSFKNPLTGKVERKMVGRSWDGEKGKYVFTPGRTALVQVCDGDLIVLVHLKDMKDLPQSIVDLIQDRSKYLLGVNISGDGRKLLSDFPTQLQRTTSLLELSRMARRIDGEAIGPGNTLIALAKLTERYLGSPLKKEGNVRRGNWAEALDAEQKEYAANDVYASYLIYQALDRLAKERGIDLNLDEFSSNQGDVPSNLAGSGDPIAKMARRGSGSSGPTPAQERVIGLFVGGENVDVIASSMGIKEGTVLGHLAGGIARVDDDALSNADKRRFLLAVGDDYWTGRTHGAVLDRIRSDLAQEPGESTDLDQIA